VKEPASAGGAWDEFDAARKSPDAARPGTPDPRGNETAEALPKIVIRDCRGVTLKEFAKKAEWRTVAAAMEDAAKKNKKAAASAEKAPKAREPR
jgi:hypothetical protein